MGYSKGGICAGKRIPMLPRHNFTRIHQRVSRDLSCYQGELFLLHGGYPNIITSARET